jgi:hypothetical protein
LWSFNFKWNLDSILCRMQYFFLIFLLFNAWIILLWWYFLSQEFIKYISIFRYGINRLWQQEKMTFKFNQNIFLLDFTWNLLMIYKTTML